MQPAWKGQAPVFAQRVEDRVGVNKHQHINGVEFVPPFLNGCYPIGLFSRHLLGGGAEPGVAGQPRSRLLSAPRSNRHQEKNAAELHAGRGHDILFANLECLALALYGSFASMADALLLAPLRIGMSVAPPCPKTENLGGCSCTPRKTRGAHKAEQQSRPSRFQTNTH